MMIYNIIFHPKAKKDLESLDKSIQQQIIKKIDFLKDNPQIGKPLSNNLKNKRSLRIGSYRVLYYLDNDDLCIIRIGHRKQIYDALAEPSNNVLDKLVIVDNLDRIIGSKEKYILSKDDIFRVSVLIVVNSKNEILLLNGKFNLENESNDIWGPTICSVNFQNDTYIGRILCDLENKFGILSMDCEFKELGKRKIKATDTKKVFVTYFLIIAPDIDKIGHFINKHKWISRMDLKKEIKKNPTDFSVYLREGLDFLNY